MNRLPKSGINKVILDKENWNPHGLSRTPFEDSSMNGNVLCRFLSSYFYRFGNFFLQIKCLAEYFQKITWIFKKFTLGSRLSPCLWSWHPTRGLLKFNFQFNFLPMCLGTQRQMTQILRVLHYLGDPEEVLGYCFWPGAVPAVGDF